jgi:hypothetical protein
MRHPDEDDEAWPVDLANGLTIDNNTRSAHSLHDCTHR